MKVIALRGENLASLSSPFEIDFVDGPLGDTGLFAITGKTGSGKSTLLDGICLALYDQIPRLEANRKNVAEIGRGENGDKLKANDVRAILSRGKVNANVELDFRGLDGRFYRVCWNVRRARARVDGKVQKQERVLVDLEKDQHFSGNRKELQQRIDQLVGLNYEQFQRSVLLPQGDFAAFLKAGNDERSALLEKMTGTEIYSKISQQVYETTKKEQQAWQRLSDKLGDVELLDDEEKDQLEIQLKQAKQTQHNVRSALDLVKRFQEQQHKAQDAKTHLAQAEAEHKAFQRQEQTSQPRRDFLTQVEKAEVARSDYDALTQSNARVGQLESQQQSIGGELEQYRGELGTKQANLGLTNDVLTQVLAQEKALKPVLTQALALDSKITQSTEKQQQQTDLIQPISQELEQKKGLLESLQLTSAELHKTKQEVTYFLKNNAEITSFAHQSQAGFGHFNDYIDAQQKLAQSQQEEQKQHQHLIQLTQHKQDAGLKLGEQETLKSRLVQQQEALKGRLGELDVQQLQQSLSQKSSQLAQIQQALTISRDWYRLLDKKTNLLKQQSQIHHELNGLNQALPKLEQQVETDRLLLGEAEHNLSQAVAVANLSDHRARLQEDQACPLCGSLEHPYVTHEPAATILSQLQQRVMQLKAQLDQQGQQLVQISSQHGKAVQADVEVQTSLAELKELARQSQQMWSDLDLDIPLSSELEGTREMGEGLVAKESSLSGELQELQQKLELVHQLQQEFQQKTTEAVALEQTAVQLRAQLQNATSQVEAGNNQLVRLAELQQEANTLLTSKAVQLDTLLEGWSEKLEQLGAQQYLLQLQQQVELFLAQESALVKLNEQLNELAPRISKEEALNQALNNKFVDEGSRLAQIGSELASLSAQRAELLDGRDVQQAEQDMVQKLAQVRLELEREQETLSQLKQSLAAKQAELEGLSQQLTEGKTEQAGLLASWAQYQQGLQLSEAALLACLEKTTLWVADERKQLSELTQGLVKAQASMDERAAFLNRLNQDNQGLDEKIQALYLAYEQDSDEILLAVVSQKLSESEQHCFGLASTLDKAADAAKSGAELQVKLQAQQQHLELWKNMNDLLGSASGAKFRTFAQSLTLDQLLIRANGQLTDLTPRYLLERVPGTDLAIQVIDRDMGDEVRSVESLSGGESFLVSLALALGLSGINGGGTSIDSLFIDEGFGTLDPDSLDLAISCLDSLQASGRQIGVISHVQTLVERIGTQVRVESLGGGQSRIKVVS